MSNIKNQLNIDPTSNSTAKYSKGFFAVFFTTFTTVFLAELGDKTQIATMLLTAQSGQPLVVFIGSALALICSSLIGVLLGRWLSRTMPTERFNYLVGILMVSIGLLLGIQSTHSMLENIT